jgi:hypothetical protein
MYGDFRVVVDTFEVCDGVWVKAECVRQVLGKQGKVSLE